MTDNKHAEAVEQCDREAVQMWFAQVTEASMFPEDVEALVQAFARHRLAALNTRPDVEAMREACARVCDAVADNSRDEGIVAAGRFCATAIRSIPVPTSGEGGDHG